MPEFASSSTNVAEITDIELAQGFGGCDVDGMLVNSANLNAVLKNIESGLSAQDSALDARTDILETLILQIVPIGGIIMWSGATVPTGWALCDGTSGTPDLRDRFVIGSGGALNIGDAGGSDSHDHGGATDGHTLTVDQMPEHNHGNGVSDDNVGNIFPYGTKASPAGGNINSDPGSFALQGLTETIGGGQPHSHGITPGSSLPPYYALAFIMKV